MGAVDLFEFVGGSGVVGGLVAAFLVRNLNKKLKAETGKLSVDGVAVLSSSSIALLEPLTNRLHEVEQQLKDVSDELTEVKRELGAAHLLVDDLNGKLDEANTRSNYFEDQWCMAAGMPLPKRNPPTGIKGN